MLLDRAADHVAKVSVTHFSKSGGVAAGVAAHEGIKQTTRRSRREVTRHLGKKGKTSRTGKATFNPRAARVSSKSASTRSSGARMAMSHAAFGHGGFGSGGGYGGGFHGK